MTGTRPRMIPNEGETCCDFIERMIEQANTTQHQVFGVYNNILMSVMPGDIKENIGAKYQAACAMKN
jgi:hypothetical protein